MADDLGLSKLDRGHEQPPPSRHLPSGLFLGTLDTIHQAGRLLCTASFHGLHDDIANSTLFWLHFCLLTCFVFFLKVCGSSVLVSVPLYRFLLHFSQKEYQSPC